VAYRLLTNVIIVVHFAFVGYVVLGGFLAWRWGWTIVPHAIAAAWGLLVVTASLNCPLTAAENWSRERTGEGPLSRGFIDRYLTGVIYPARYLHQVQLFAAALVLVSWVGVGLRWQAQRR
jgi:Protein of Unknown function (DUF2784)